MLVRAINLWQVLLFTAILLLMFSARSIGAGIQSFAVSGGDAAQTLKQFAKQAGLSIVCDPQGVQGVQTRGVMGRFIPEDALERMIDGTPLVFKQDLETGAIAVTRSEASVAELTTQRPEHKPK